MKTICNHRFTAVFVLIILLLLPGVSAYGSDSGVIYTEGSLEYTIEDYSITICGYFGTDSEVVVPAMIAGYPVYRIASGTFTYSFIDTVYLPDSVTTVEEGAFGPDVSVIFGYDPTQESTGNGSTDQGAGGSAAGTAGNGSDTQSETVGGYQNYQADQTEPDQAQSQTSDQTTQETQTQEKDPYVEQHETDISDKTEASDGQGRKASDGSGIISTVFICIAVILIGFSLYRYIKIKQ